MNVDLLRVVSDMATPGPWSYGVIDGDQVRAMLGRVGDFGAVFDSTGRVLFVKVHSDAIPDGALVCAARNGIAQVLALEGDQLDA